MQSLGLKAGRLRPRSVICFLLLTVSGWAQTGTGNIQGTVKDATGAVVPGARVTITHTPTARPNSTTTTELGFYLFQIGRAHV